MKAGEQPGLLENTVALNAVVSKLYASVGEAILNSWGFPDSLVAVVAEHGNLDRDSENGPDLVDVVQVVCRPGG